MLRSFLKQSGLTSSHRQCMSPLTNSLCSICSARRDCTCIVKLEKVDCVNRDGFCMD